MPDDNRNGPLSFTGPTIPIIGQPFTVKAVLATVMGLCNCPAKEPLLLAGAGVVACPSCRRQFQIQQVSCDVRTGQTNVKIGLVMSREDALAQGLAKESVS